METPRKINVMLTFLFIEGHNVGEGIKSTDLKPKYNSWMVQTFQEQSSVEGQRGDCQMSEIKKQEHITPIEEALHNSKAWNWGPRRSKNVACYRNIT